MEWRNAEVLRFLSTKGELRVCNVECESGMLLVDYPYVLGERLTTRITSIMNCVEQKQRSPPRQQQDEQGQHTPNKNLLQLLSLKPWVTAELQQYDNDEVRKVILADPNSVRVKYDFKSGGRGYVCRYPLFRAIALGASLDVVELMSFPETIQEQGVFRTTPLHSACAYQGSLAVIQFLLRQYPDATKIQNKGGYTPLHAACEHGASSVEVIKLLVEAYPEARSMKNKLKATPYDSAKQNGTNDAILRLVKVEAILLHNEDSTAEVSSGAF